MAVLKVTPQELHATAQNMTNITNQMDNIANQMAQHIERMQNDVWDSGSGRAFVQQFNNVRSNTRGGHTALTTHYRNLAEAARVYERIEQEQTQKASSLDASKIF